MMKIVLYLVLLLSVCQTESARILGVFPVPTYSHYTLGNVLMKALAEKGHDVTIITSHREKNPPKLYREVFLEGALEESEERRKNLAARKETSWWPELFSIHLHALQFTEKALSNPHVQQLLNETFDLVIVEQFNHEVFKGFAYHFNTPLVAFSSTATSPWVNSLLGNPTPRSYIPDFSLPYSPRMTFWQRLHNLWYGVFKDVKHQLFFVPEINKALQKYFPGSPTVEELTANISVMLVNTHTSSNQPIPHVPNMIEIGGFHVFPPKQLPEDLQKYLDDAQEGVVYFSMGSNVRSKHFPEEKKKSILSAFSKINLKVLWKYEDDDLSDIPTNVQLRKWLPQQDILAHPNVKLFITQGGMLSTIEAIHCGVPILGIPMVADQKMNMANSVSLGIGEIIKSEELTEETFLGKINTILGNPKYRANVKRRSAIMRDRPVPPLENAVFWVEYVLRHRGAPHFRSAALDLKWYQYHMLDVIAFVLTASVTSFTIIYYIFIIIRRRYLGRRRTDNRKKIN